MPRPPRARTAEGAAAGARTRRTAAAAPPPPPPAQSSADQNLAEMAQRLEAALRRPADETGEPRRSARPGRARIAAGRRPRNEPMAPPAPPPPKSGFENLEDEMASLLGRPKIAFVRSAASRVEFYSLPY